ncbi:phospholipase A2 inhibitor [Cephus cinctus]|uniref:Phospholipase A2 inhibitor n=1 Tax=Cephus cinctus TaxID=211228 RepID=A0AAJ7CFT9_CEPCN|nr:phospholipase A2 inhibitor [Cephus cinctus]
MWIRIFIVLGFIAVSTMEKRLDLSSHSLTKEKFFLELQAHINLHEVTDLILHNNNFDSFLDCSANLDALRTLDLSYNHLQRFFFLCKEEYNLIVLNVSHNHLEYISEDSLNHRIPNLQVLDLSWNRLTGVNETMLEHMQKLNNLSMASNPIGNGIHENAFSNLSLLTHLNLENISANYFPDSLFQPLSSLLNLNISYNPIETIPALPTSLESLDISGTNIFYVGNVILPNLLELYMNDMPNVTSVALNDFENFTKLNVLSISRCKNLVQLRVWPPRNDLLPHLSELSVENDSLNTIDVYLQPIMQRTHIVRLGGNPWTCDCNMQWVLSLNNTNNPSSEIRCSSPKVHENKQLSSIPSHELQCEFLSSDLYLALWACVLVLILAGILATVFFVARGPLTQWLLRRKRRDTVTYTNVMESTDNLVRILADDESRDGF